MLDGCKFVHFPLHFPCRNLHFYNVSLFESGTDFLALVGVPNFSIDTVICNNLIRVFCAKEGTLNYAYIDIIFFSFIDPEFVPVVRSIYFHCVIEYDLMATLFFGPSVHNSAIRS